MRSLSAILTQDAAYGYPQAILGQSRRDAIACVSLVSRSDPGLPKPSWGIADTEVRDFGACTEPSGPAWDEPEIRQERPELAGLARIAITPSQADSSRRGMSARRAAPSLACSLSSGHDVQVAVSIGVLIERFYGELWNRWNDSAVEDTLSPGFTFRGSLGQETSEWQGWRRYRDLVREGSADFHNEIVELVCDGGRAAARLRFTGTHTGPLLGLPATQRRFEYAGAAFFTADERWLTSAWVLGDLDALRRQLS